MSDTEATDRSSRSFCTAATNCMVDTMASRVGVWSSACSRVEELVESSVASMRRGAAGPILVPASISGEEASFDSIFLWNSFLEDGKFSRMVFVRWSWSTAISTNT